MNIKRHLVENSLFYLLLVAGILSRLFFAVKLPIWHDEFYSIWASGFSVFEISHSLTDFVHPPGYYLILHFWGMISEHLYWFRFLSVIAFTANVFLIKKLSDKLGKSEHSWLLVLLYIFSGYFVVFDWQVRMYTLIDTLILFSIHVLTDIKGSIKNKISSWSVFTLVNFLGLYVDYAYVWYFVPMVIFLLMYFGYKKDIKFWHFLYSSVWSSLLFVFAIPSIFITSRQGINGIAWMADYAKAHFFVPFFLGSHWASFLTVVFSLMLLAGVYGFFRSERRNFVGSLVIFCALLSSAAALTYTYFFIPAFHVRSLQIVGFMVLIFYYFGLKNIPKAGRGYILAVFLSWYLFNFLTVGWTLFRSPGSLLIDYFPWRDVLNQTELTGVGTVKYKIIIPIPTQMLLYGLEYTLEGNENIGRKPIKLERMETESVECVKFYEGVLTLYKCP